MMMGPKGGQLMFENLFGSGKKKPAKEPATEKQKKFAEKLGVKNADSLSKEASSAESVGEFRLG